MRIPGTVVEHKVSPHTQAWRSSKIGARDWLVVRRV